MYEVDLSPSLSQDEQTIVVSALEDWESTTPVVFHVAIVEGLDCSSSGRICVSPTDSLPSSAELGVTREGYDQDGGAIYLLRPIGRQTVIHEVGHGMGLEHSPYADGSAVMFPGRPGAAETVQCSDVWQWFGLRGRVAPNCQWWTTP